jgi:gluconate 5-dehydrogenase
VPHVIDAHTFRLDGRIALVTGSSTGIGLAIARGLGQAGAVVLLNARDATRLAAARETLVGEGIVAHARAFDVTDAAAVEAAVASVEAEIGPIAILVNNAGMTRRGAFHEQPQADWEAVLRGNLASVFIVGQAVARRMVARKRGRIINIASVNAELTRPSNTAYSTTKAAVKMLTKGMAVDLAPHGINVNAIGPGYFKTDLTAPVAANPALSQWLTSRTPMGRWGELHELAPAAVFLASDAASFVTGHTLYVDGGITATL